MNIFKSDQLIAEYIWIDGYNDLRSKIKVLKTGVNYSIENIPIGNVDGSSTKQASIENSEVILRPVQMYRNPFYNNGYLVLCETYIQDNSGHLNSHPSNNRCLAQKYFQYIDYFKPQYEIEQEYYILDPDTNKPYKSHVNREMHYCGIRAPIKERIFAESHMNACLYAGLKVSSINASIGQGQWKYKIGPVKSIEAADQLWVARYIMQRVAEYKKIAISLHPKPFGGEFPGSGAHINFSTLQMRLPNGYTEIIKTIEQLRNTHDIFMQNCGEDSIRRMTGDHGTAIINYFSWGIGGRNTSIKIPKETVIKQCGYFQDRRPSANMDPYKICGLLLNAVISQEIH